jgi:peptidoglycan biosynthesis protein MviN/MurJ (putative lipid II flippase)
MRIRIRRDEKTSMRFLNFFLVLYIILTVIIGVILLIYPQKIFLFISNFDSSAVAVNRKLIFLLVPVFVLMPVSGLLSEILASYRFFTIPMIIGIINGLFSILFVIFFHSTLDTLSMMLALVVSYSINLGILVYLMIRRIGGNSHFLIFILRKEFGGTLASLRQVI